MKQSFYILLFLVAGFTADAQIISSWKIKFYNKTILSTSVESEDKNVRKIKKEDLKKTGFLEIDFIEAEKDTWYRSFLFYDKDDNELLRIDSAAVTAKVAFTQLRQLYRNKKEIIIYTAATPQDPSLAIRMRRVHLCTLQIK